MQPQLRYFWRCSPEKRHKTQQMAAPSPSIPLPRPTADRLDAFLFRYIFGVFKNNVPDILKKRKNVPATYNFWVQFGQIWYLILAAPLPFVNNRHSEAEDIAVNICRASAAFQRIISRFLTLNIPVLSATYTLKPSDYIYVCRTCRLFFTAFCFQYPVVFPMLAADQLMLYFLNCQ